MADVTRFDHEDFTINAANDYYLPGPPAGSVRVKVIALISSSFSGTVTVKARKQGSSDAPVAVPYKKLHLNGLAGDASYVSTGITGTSLIEVPCEGMDVVLSTAYTSGSLAVRHSDHAG